MKEKNDYVSPEVKVIFVGNAEVLCASTEGYGVSGHSYGEDDWE